VCKVTTNERNNKTKKSFFILEFPNAVFTYVKLVQMSGKTKNIFVFSRMQPNFMAQSGIKLLQMSGITKQKTFFI